MSGYRPLYTLEEDRKMVRFIIADGSVRTIKGNQFWKKMAKDQIIPGRTWQSLKSRWIKYISVDVGRPEYGLSHDEIVTLKAEMGLGSSTVEWKKASSQNNSDKNEPGHPLPGKTTDLAVNEEREEPSKEDKDFYSLDMNWSDSDTE